MIRLLCKVAIVKGWFVQVPVFLCNKQILIFSGIQIRAPDTQEGFWRLFKSFSSRAFHSKRGVSNQRKIQQLLMRDRQKLQQITTGVALSETAMTVDYHTLISAKWPKIMVKTLIRWLNIIKLKPKKFCHFITVLSQVFNLKLFILINMLITSVSVIN